MEEGGGGGERKGRGNEREKGGRKIVGEIRKWGKRREVGEILCSQVYLEYACINCGALQTKHSYS